METATFHCSKSHFIVTLVIWAIARLVALLFSIISNGVLDKICVSNDGKEVKRYEICPACPCCNSPSL